MGNPVPVFSGIDLVIEAGQTVAFVGESGSGKSTIGKLVQRCYDPDRGSISIDGVELKDLDVNSLRSSIGVVSQEPLLFDKSIRENISYGLPDEDNIPIERIRELREPPMRTASSSQTSSQKGTIRWSAQRVASSLSDKSSGSLSPELFSAILLFLSLMKPRAL